MKNDYRSLYDYESLWEKAPKYRPSGMTRRNYRLWRNHKNKDGRWFDTDFVKEVFA